MSGRGEVGRRSEHLTGPFVVVCASARSAWPPSPSTRPDIPPPEICDTPQVTIADTCHG